MPVFKYRAKDGVKDVEGVLEAPSREEVIDQLHHKGYVPVRIEQGAGKAEPAEAASAKVTGKVRSKDVTVFSRQLASLIKSGVPVLRGLRIICEQADNPSFKRVLDDIHASVKDGRSVSGALSKYPRIFPSLYIAMVRSGEAGGTLQEVLVRISDYRQKQEEILSRVRTALAYPVLMALVGLGTIIFMIAFVMPRLMKIFSRMGQELPLPTRIVIKISQEVQQGWIWMIAAAAVFVFLFRQLGKSRAQRLLLSRLKLRLPVWGDFALKSELARFSRTLELLIRSNIPILQAIKTAVPTLDNEIIKNELTRCAKDLEEGASFGKSLEKSKIFPGFMTSLLIVGEESGRLDNALAEIAGSYERDTDEAIKILTSLMEPLMILVMGLVVGFIVVAMLLPIFQMNMMAG
jgi:type II secretory pathway component PulF